jgi:Esterase FrsA-like
MPPAPAADRRPRRSPREKPDQVVDDPSSGRSRRSLLRAGVLGGGAAALLAAGGIRAAGTAALAAQAPPAAHEPLQNLFTLSALDFETLFAFGSIGYGCAEFGELATMVNQVNAAGASLQTYYDTFLAMAGSVGALADRELAAGHVASARSAYLRASYYYDMCLYYILGTSARARQTDAYAAMERCWQRASELFDPPFEPVRIPYGNSWLPGWLLRPDARPVRRPTVILNNGEDSQSVEMYVDGGAAALERGYNALIFEGPGQGSMLFERQIPFRPDWENVITPVVDYLVSRPDVDPSHIALIGMSLGGELVVRAAAFEHRLAAVVADPGCLSLWLATTTVLPPIGALFTGRATKEQVNDAWAKDFVPTFDAVTRYELAKGSEPLGRQFLSAALSGRVFTDLHDFGTTLMQFTCAQVADRVTAPTLVTAYQDDTLIVPASGQAPEVYKLLRSDKQYHYFTAAEGAQYHCAPMAPQTRNQVVFGWLDDTL